MGGGGGGVVVQVVVFGPDWPLCVHPLLICCVDGGGFGAFVDIASLLCVKVSQ